MAKTLDRLTHRGAVALKTPGLHADGGGLYLEVDPSGAKRWTFLFQWDRKRKQMGLGGFDTLDLKDAREAAASARKLVQEGKSPIEERKAERAREAGATFGEVADQLILDLTPQWKSAKHAKQWTATIDGHAGALRPKPVAAVTTDDVIGVLKPIWSTTPETATRVRGRIERVLDAAKARGLRTGENPARWRGHLALLMPRRKGGGDGHHPALPYADIHAFMQDLAGRPATAARALEWTIWTAARSGETFGARWCEVDLEAKVWTVPAERMKGNRPEHRVPLSPPAVALAIQLLADERGAGRGGDAPESFLFPSEHRRGKPLSNMAMEMLLRRMDRDDITVHGFRSSFKDWASEETDFVDELSEVALAHVVGKKVRRAYKRNDLLEKRRALMDAWATYCATKPPEEAAQAA